MIDNKTLRGAVEHVMKDINAISDMYKILEKEIAIENRDKKIDQYL